MWPVFMFQLILQFIGHISALSFIRGGDGTAPQTLQQHCALLGDGTPCNSTAGMACPTNPATALPFARGWHGPTNPASGWHAPQILHQHCRDGTPHKSCNSTAGMARPTNPATALPFARGWYGPTNPATALPFAREWYGPTNPASALPFVRGWHRPTNSTVLC